MANRLQKNPPLLAGDSAAPRGVVRSTSKQGLRGAV